MTNPTASASPRRFPLALLTCLTLGAALVSPTRAFADDASGSEVASEPSRPASRHVLVANLLATLIGRFGVDYAFLPVAHHALQVGGHVQLLPPLGRTDEVTGFGGELGYRFYSGRSGPSGLFVGASGLLGRYHWIEGGDEAHQGTNTRYGVAVDAGYSLFAGKNFVFALGAGVELAALSGSPGVPELARLIVRTGIGPRGLVQMGFAF